MATLVTADLAIERVKELHRCEREEVLPWACYNGDCDHEDECPLVECDSCRECSRIALDVNDEAGVVVWPCRTIKAIEGSD